MKKWTLIAFAIAVTTLLGCSKNSSSIKLEVYIVEANTNQEFPASNATVTLKAGDEVFQTGKCNSQGVINFEKLPKKDNWSVASTYTLNGINYSGSQSAIETNGKTGISARLNLRY